MKSRILNLKIEFQSAFIAVVCLWPFSISDLRLPISNLESEIRNSPHFHRGRLPLAIFDFRFAIAELKSGI
jgi:hypothetical protein